MKYCRKCLNVSTRPNIVFSEDGICPPCQCLPVNKLEEEEVKNKALEEIIQFAKNNSNNGFDCIVGVSGGKDSTRQALHIKERFGLNPLLVSMNYPPEQISKNGVNNLSSLIKNGFTCINISCGPNTWKRAMRYAFLNYGNWAKSTEHALFASVPRIAIAYQIPLIWWGENPALQLGELGTKRELPYDGNSIKYNNTLSGGNIDWLLSSGIEMNKLIQYKYPSDHDMDLANLKIIFMDYFMKDFSQLTNGIFASLRGLSVREPNPKIDPDYFGTSMLDEDFINTNMYIRYLKFGFGRASDIVNIEIRAGRLTRDEGIEIVEKFDSNYDEEVLDKFCEYIDISTKTFWSIVDKYVNKKLFKKVKNNIYEPLFKVGLGI